MKKSDNPIIVEQSYNVSAKTVWEAITQIEQMRKWFFDNIPAFEPVVGFEVQFNIVSGKRNFLHQWKIIEVIPNKKIVYNWKYKGFAGEALVAFELFELNDVTTIKLSSHVLEDFDDNIPEFKRESGVAGWTYFIKQSLKEYLDK